MKDNKKLLGTRIRGSVYNGLEEMAKQHNMSFYAFIEKILEEYYNMHKQELSNSNKVYIEDNKLVIPISILNSVIQK